MMMAAWWNVAKTLALLLIAPLAIGWTIITIVLNAMGQADMLTQVGSPDTLLLPIAVSLAGLIIIPLMAAVIIFTRRRVFFEPPGRPYRMWPVMVTVGILIFWAVNNVLSIISTIELYYTLSTANG